ncbi:MAG: TRAP transporter substrate-binding protein [Oscillospiraceae bacterium]
MKSKLLALVLASTMLFTACGGKETKTDETSKPSADGDVIEITYGHGFNPGTPQALAADEFKKRVEEETEGRVVVNVFPAGQLGSAREMYESVQMGVQQIALLPTARISGFCKELQIFDMPFLFPDKETAYKIFDGPEGKEILGALEPSGIKGLAIYEDGFKQFTCNQKLESAADFKGLKFRTMESAIIMEQFKAMGSNPVPVDFGELYNALQQKTVDGQENPLVTIESVRLYEVQKHLLMSNHAYLGHIFLASKGWLEGLPEDIQEVITRNAQEIAVWERELVAKEEEGYLQTIKDSGTVVTEISDEAANEMRELMKPVYKIAEDVIGKELVDKVVAAAQK